MPDIPDNDNLVRDENEDLRHPPKPHEVEPIPPEKIKQDAAQRAKKLPIIQRNIACWR